MDPERLDLSSLKPWKDEASFDEAVNSIVQRVHQRNYSLGHQLLRTARPILSLAASLVLIIWSTVWISGAGSSSQVAQNSDPATQIMTWAMNDTIPSSTEVYKAFGGTYEQN